MSLTRWPGLRPRQARDAASINDFADAFEAITAVGSPNLAEEGIDRRVLEPLLVGERKFRIVENTRATITTNTGSTWTQWNPSGTPFRQSLLGGLDDDEVLELIACVQLTSEQGGVNGLGADSELRLRLAWNEGSTTTGMNPVSFGGLLAFADRPHGALVTFGAILGPVASVDWVELQYRAQQRSGGGGAVSVSPHRSTFIGNIYRRAR